MTVWGLTAERMLHGRKVLSFVGMPGICFVCYVISYTPTPRYITVLLMGGTLHFAYG